jgi:hypothetical protein
MLEKFDIVIFMKLVEYLKGGEILNLFNVNKKINNLYRRNKENIWINLLRNKYQINKKDIIGEPLSFYLGIERQIFWYYTYDTSDLKTKIEKKKPKDYFDYWIVPGIKKAFYEEYLGIVIMKNGRTTFLHDWRERVGTLNGIVNEIIIFIEEFESLNEKKYYNEIKNELNECQKILSSQPPNKTPFLIKKDYVEIKIIKLEFEEK